MFFRILRTAFNKAIGSRVFRGADTNKSHNFRDADTNKHPSLGEVDSSKSSSLRDVSANLTRENGHRLRQAFGPTFQAGFKSMLPITTGVLPFGLIMGTVFNHAKVTNTQAWGMNLLVFGGSSQLAVIELMLQNSSVIVVIATGLIINLRFMLYSAAFTDYIQNSNFWMKIFCTYSLTDQTYAVLKANEQKMSSNAEVVQFYVGASFCMLIAWHGAVGIGMIFGNLLPASLSLDYAIPLSFVGLLLPTVKDRNYLYVALLATVLSIVFTKLPYGLGLLASTLVALLFAVFLTRNSNRDLKVKSLASDKELEFALNVDLESKKAELYD